MKADGRSQIGQSNHAGVQAVDMSPEAIDQRLDMVSALYDLGKFLQTARPVENAVEQTSQHSVDENAQQ